MRTASNKQVFTRTILGAALTLAFGAAFADDALIAEFAKPTSEVSVGIGNWSNPRPQLGIYDGFRDDGTTGSLDFDLVRRNDDTGTWLTLGGHLGKDDPWLTGGIERQGGYRALFRYQELTRDNPYRFFTATTGAGTTTAVTPAPSAAASALAGMDIATRRKGLGFELSKFVMPDLEFVINLKDERKDGKRLWGRGGAPEFALEPIDFRTRQIELMLNHTGKQFQMTGGYIGSRFENANRLVTTSLSTGAANSFYYLSLPMDNEAHQWFVTGGYSLSPTTRATFKLERSTATQDEHLPTADIPGLANASAPDSIDGKIETMLYQVGLTARPTKDLSLTANLRYRDEEDKTPVRQIVFGSASVHNTPYSYELLTGKVDATYRLTSDTKLSGSIEVKNQDRSIPVGDVDASGLDEERYVPFRTSLDETTYALKLRRSLTDTWSGSLTWAHAERDGSAYSHTHHAININPIHIADRDRDRVRLGLEWLPTKALSFQLNYESARDSYPHNEHTRYGVRKGSAELLSLDADLAISEESSLTAWYSSDRAKATQYNARFNRITEVLEAEYLTHLRDEGDSFGIGYRRTMSENLRFGMDAQWTQTQSQYPMNVTLVGNVVGFASGTFPLPNIENKFKTLKLFAEYALNKNADLRVDLIHEDWRTDDWTWFFADGSPFTYGAATGNAASDGSRVVADPEQKSTFIGLRYIVRFQ